MIRRFLLVLLILAGAAAAFVAYGWWGNGPTEEETGIIVTEGTGIGALGQQLAENDQIKLSPSLWRLGARVLGGNEPIQAGEFTIPPGASAAQILDILQNGKAVQRFVTIPEGMPSVLVQERIDAAILLEGDTPLPEEGSLLPDTYSYQRGETRAELVERMQAAMDEAIAELWPQRSENAVVTSPREAIILASIVEKETAQADERRMVAGVLSNRIRQGMMLGADATTIYPITQGRPLGRQIRRSELDDPNPYNTRAITGLPVGPITNPGIESIRAVLDPADTEALYYVADGTGGHVFARTLEEHNENVRRWRAIRAERGI
ncbi:endolytic transglycosylase MltG [Sphingomicrobium sediminis]|uniref:Endolytic murein transglycosylase n=1 Tax=Sphingomicrobium sediminis TaxID=2950949 RepID=A0A9X2J1W5_9SPHN|nr:endolytic transglycosylase MltG [Sphingomicrobium sediminis]MCM8557169.1 endolytic transglycosylase MltG [Sphingomicrobium sediminis]